MEELKNCTLDDSTKLNYTIIRIVVLSITIASSAFIIITILFSSKLKHYTFKLVLA